MSVDSTGRRAARIAKLFVDLTWWLGLALSAVVVVVVLTAPFHQQMGVAARFGWNNFHFEGGREPPAIVVRVTPPAEGTRITLSSTSADTMQAPRPVLLRSQVANLQVATRHWTLLYASNATLLLYFAAMIWGVYLLRTFLADVLSGETFTTRNARRLSRLGWLVIVVAIVGPQLERLRTYIVLKQVQFGGATLSPVDADANALWLVGVLALVFAAAWRHGADLQQQNDLTV